jgi:muramidase (phage lysozyme)
MPEDYSFYAQQVQKPSVRRLLNTIRYAEGTAGPQGYQTKYGGGLFNDFSRHPDQAVSSGKHTSTAAGAYQFLTPTWQSVSSKLGLRKFGPQEQDIAAAYLADQRLKSLGGLAALDKQGMSPQVASALAPEWASFPTMKGGSYYGQPSKNIKELQTQYGIAPGPSSTTPTTSSSVNQQTRTGNTYNFYVNDDADPDTRNFLTRFMSEHGLPNLADSSKSGVSPFDPNSMVRNLQKAMYSETVYQ